jgi:hypothetical protein
MKIFELGVRTFLQQNGWNQIAENEYEKGNRTIVITNGKQIEMYQDGTYLLTAEFGNFEIGLTRYFIES